MAFGTKTARFVAERRERRLRRTIKAGEELLDAAPEDDAEVLRDLAVLRGVLERADCLRAARRTNAVIRYLQVRLAASLGET